jgi:flagellar FliJ protein
MAVFKFRMQRLLEQREREEGFAQRDVAELQRECIAIENAIRNRQLMIDDAKEGIRAALSGGSVDPRAARMQAGESIHHVMHAQRLALLLAGVHTRLEQARRALQECMKRRKAVELLRDRDFERWKRELDRREAAELDDIGTSGWIRRRNAAAEAQA